MLLLVFSCGAFQQLLYLSRDEAWESINLSIYASASGAPLVGAASEADRSNPHPPTWSLPFAHNDARTHMTPHIQSSDWNSVPSSSSVRLCTAARTELFCVCTLDLFRNVRYIFVRRRRASKPRADSNRFLHSFIRNGRRHGVDGDDRHLNILRSNAYCMNVTITAKAASLSYFKSPVAERTVPWARTVLRVPARQWLRLFRTF